MVRSAYVCIARVELVKTYPRSFSHFKKVHADFLHAWGVIIVDLKSEITE